MKLQHKIALSILTGVLVCLSFPTTFYSIELPAMGFLGWIALVPLITVIRRETPRRAFLYTFIAAIVFYSGSLFWVYNAMYAYGGISLTQSILITILLILVVSIYISLAPFFARSIESRYWGEFIVWLPAAWVGVELLRNYVPCNGFPWSNIAMSQWQHLPLIQIVDLVGIYGLMFLMVWVNVFIAELIAKMRGEAVQFFIPKSIITALLVISTLGYGFYRLNTIPKTLSAYPSFAVGMIQGNIPQGKKWEPKSAVDNLNVYRVGAGKLMQGSVELIMWTEASFPWVIKTTDTNIDPKALGMPGGIVTKTPYTLFGAVSENEKGTYHNSAILFDAEGEIVGRYHKTHLVPFGEYIPYQRIFFFARKFTELAGTFENGKSYDPLVAGAGRLGMLICYEDVFPEISRKTVMHGANLLTNITNDAWFGPFSAQRQHFALSIFRAIENRRFMVRANNSGISAVVMPTGEVTVESKTFEPALLVSPVALMDVITPYTRYGDWFANACLIYTLLGMIMTVIKRRQKPGDEK